MADTLDVLTLAEAKTAINTDSADHDTELALHITAVSRRLDDLCGPVVQRTVTDELHDGGCHRLLLRHTPIVSVTSVTEYVSTTSTALSAESNASKPASGYLLEADGHYVSVRRRRGNTDATFPNGRRNVAVTYEAGRATDTASVDELFKLAAASILRRLWKRESSAWAQAPSYFADVDDPSPTVGFYRAVDPMVNELLADELAPHSRGLLVR